MCLTMQKYHYDNTICTLNIFVNLRCFNELLNSCVAQFILLKVPHCSHAEISDVFHSTEHIDFLFIFDLFNQVVNCTKRSAMIRSVTKQNKVEKVLRALC